MSAKALRETIGFLGVTASLIFVGLEVRQNTVATRAAAIQASIGVARDQIQMFALDAEANRINMKGRDGLAALTDEEKERYRWITLSFFWGMQGLHSQHEVGVLPDDEWQAWLHVICINMAYAGVREVWSQATFYTEAFREVAESCPPPPPPG